jgi:signal transduction histidine kinase
MVFADLTQELRTSLQTITGFTEILLAGTVGDLNDEQVRQLAMVFDAGKRLGALVSSLLETQRTDESELVAEREILDTVALVESVVFGLRSFAEEKGLSLELVAEERPLPVESDRYKVQKILLNLLSNAIRYTEHGGVTVTLEREGEELVVIRVADTGAGIPPNRLKALFEGPDAHAPAAGIGLPASRRIAGVLGAELRADSVLGEGSVFTLKLPVPQVVDVPAGDGD